ncbi:S-layer homology domain-containing protein [Paenibacillus ginsengarvi]|uniref:SLH domain-containing protein n=1 Tax=Paenibacillus ginsengarvi TaxID=400777 RepID=A0A3B0BYZ6_9BACL|nr:S-layer homology domain-containing protein [Paenibacillus ginsengarvi]RKN78863.1 hypothetical protein D7M11_22575 [Paenibacillus ginsengarvi]
MSNKSFPSKLNTQTSYDDNRGGEKKVMKKSLSVLVATAMVSSVFASVAFAADTTLTTQQKLDALIAAGIFDKDGTGNGSELDANMSREQLAKILAKLKDLKEVSGTSYTDVAADRWSAGFIQAVSKATPVLMDGVADGVFNPSGEVTLEQLATVAVRALGLQPNNSGAVKGNVSSWAKGYVATAIANGLLSEKADFTKSAIRSELVEATYGAKEAIEKANVPAQVSVKEVKATGVKTVTVALDRDVDTSKATVTLKKGSTAITTTTKWSADKKTATLTLTETTLKAGEYTVTLGGLDASAIKTAEGKFTAEDEKVQKIDFVNANDTIAYAKNTVVKIKASNQYGENASSSAGNYNVYGATKLTKDAEGYLLATVDTTTQSQGVGIVTLTIINNDSHVSATKNFKVGTAPILSKLELGDPQYSNGTAVTGSGDNVKFTLNLYDQYGGSMGYDALNIGSTGELKPTVIWNTYLEGVNYATEDNGNNVPILKINLTKNVDKDGDYTFTVINQAASASGKITVKSAKVATKVEIGAPEGDVIAAGDKNVYVPIIAYDAAGNVLSASDLVSDENLKRIMVSSNASTSTQLVASGENKGKVLLDNVPGSKNSAVSLNVFIATANVQSNASKTFTVQQARIPDFIKEVTVPGKQLAPGGSTAFKYAIYDQYGKVMDTVNQVDSQGNISASGSTFKVTVTANTYDANGNLVTGITKGNKVETLPNALAYVTTDADSADSNVVQFDSTAKEFGPDVKTGFGGSTYRFAAKNTDAAKGYKVELTVKLWKDSTELSKVVRSVTVANVTSSDMTYSLNAVAALYNAKDQNNYSVTDAVYNKTSAGVEEKFERKDQIVATSKFGREVVVSAKNAAGETVGIPKQIISIQPTDSSIVNTLVVPQANGNSKAYVIGVKPGTTTVTVSFLAPDGSTKTLDTSVTVKGDAMNVTKVSWDAKAYNDKLTFNAFINANIVDNYNVTFEDATAQKYNYLLGATFGISNVSGGTAKVDQYGNVTATPTVAGGTVVFDLSVNAAGKSATTTIYANAATTTRSEHK